MMDRRRFLQLFGAGAAAAIVAPAIPFGRVWSFPKELVIARARPNAVRFIKAWDPLEARALCRLDVLYNFVPINFANAPCLDSHEVVCVSRSSEIQAAIDHLAREHHFPSLPASILEDWIDHRSEMPQFASVDI